MCDNTSTPDTDFVPLRVDPQMAGSVIEVKVNGRYPTTLARIDNDGYLRSTKTQALFSRDQTEIHTDLDIVTGSDMTYHGFKHGWSEGNAPIVDA